MCVFGSSSRFGDRALEILTRAPSTRTEIPWSTPTATAGRRLRSAAPSGIPAVRCVRGVVVDGRDVPSGPGRKAHNCHQSRGAGGVSPKGP